MWWQHWFRPSLPEDLARRVLRWAALPQADLNIPLDRASFAVIDTETTGLNPRRDAMLSIGAVMLRGSTLGLGESFHCYIASEQESSRENVLVHGIAPSQQIQGAPPASCLIEFLDFCGGEPLVAFHAPFDRAFLSRAVRRWLGARLGNPFLDLAWLLPALFPAAAGPRAGLDDWARHFHLHIPRRHSADADALAAGELTLVALAEARRRHVPNVRALLAMARHTAQLTLPGSRGPV
jgi:DNA polymerase III subunit epsilon